MEEFSNSATRQVLNLGTRSMGWIRNSISALMTDLATRRQGDPGWKAMLLLGPDSAELVTRPRGQPARIASFPASAEGLGQGLSRHLSPAECQRLALRILPARAVVSHFVLPQTAAAVIGPIVRNKIESFAPWPLTEAVWGYRVLPGSDPKQIAVETVAVGRRALDRTLASLAAAGARVTQIDIAAEETASDAITLDFRADLRRARVSALFRTAALAACLACLAVGGYGAYRAVADYLHLQANEARIGELKQALLARSDPLGGSGKLQEAIRLVERKSAQKPLVVVLNALTQLVPDGTWLTTVDVSGRTLKFSGLGNAVPEVISRLETSDMFAKVDFAAATQHDSELNADMFSLSAAIEDGGASP